MYICTSLFYVNFSFFPNLLHSTNFNFIIIYFIYFFFSQSCSWCSLVKENFNVSACMYSWQEILNLETFFIFQQIKTHFKWDFFEDQGEKRKLSSHFKNKLCLGFTTEDRNGKAACYRCVLLVIIKCIFGGSRVKRGREGVEACERKGPVSICQ